MRALEALALGLCMSARGAMGLVVAVIGLSLAVIGPELFAIIVLMAIVTSFLAPLTVRPVVWFLPPTEEELAREKGEGPAFLRRGHAKLLVPTGGGRNALLGCHLAAGVCRADGDEAQAVYIETHRPRLLTTILFWRRRGVVDVKMLEGEMRAAAGPAARYLAFRTVPSRAPVPAAILAEAQRGFTHIVLGASGESHPLYDPTISAIVSANLCHVVIARSARAAALPEEPIRHILVPTNGSTYADAAFQMAAAFAESSGGKVSVLHVVSVPERNPLAVADRPGEPDPEHMVGVLRKQYAGQMREDRLDCRVRIGRSAAAGIAEEAAVGGYDLVVVGAENKSIVERVYFGHTIDALLEGLACPIAIVVPKTVRG
jgi:nucleotide-binding universal stress UspA family protein